MSIQFKLYETVNKIIWFQRDILRPVFTSSAAWSFVTSWAAAAIYLVATGLSYIVLWCFLSLAVLTIFCVITVGITKPEHKPKIDSSWTTQVLLLLQVAVIVFFICITGYTSLMFHGILQSHPIPVWSHVIDVFSRMGERLLNANIVGYPALAMANPVKYFLLPLPLLLLFGARFSELGFSRGHHTVSVLALWCIVPAVLLVFQLTFGYLTFGILSRRFIRHFLQNGFGEEFLFRGALQTRLRVLFNSSWAIVIQALIFGIWHFGKHFINLKQVDINSIAATVAFSIAGTAIFGIAYGIIFQRTRNLLACSVIHVVFNSLGG